MSSSLSDVSCNVAMAIFDSYSKTVMRNLVGQTKKEVSKRSKNEIVSSDTMQYVSDTHGQKDVYPSEFVVTDGHGHSCVVTLEWLYQAMSLLPQKQKEVLILEFWYGLSAKELSQLLHVARKTVYNRKQKAFSFIREYYERTQKTNEYERTYL